MISEERLSIIIQEKGEVWCISKYHMPYRVIPVIFDGKPKIEPHSFITGWGAKNIYETKEEAEECLTYGNITRTEKFPYVSWEEFNKVYSFAFESKERIMLEVAIWFNSESGDDIKTIRITNLNDWNICYFEQPLTRENYHKALDLCVKLWKGEK